MIGQQDKGINSKRIFSIRCLNVSLNSGTFADSQRNPILLYATTVKKHVPPLVLA